MNIFKKKGFTLIELMIVVAIIGILAAVAIPRFASLLEKAREGATKGNVGAIKAAISIYYGDKEGRYPVTLVPNQGFSSYLDDMPAVKVQHPANIFPGQNTLSGTSTSVSIATVATPSIAATTDGWIYSTVSGKVWVNNSQTDTKGTSYTMYGYE